MDQIQRCSLNKCWANPCTLSSYRVVVLMQFAAELKRLQEYRNLSRLIKENAYYNELDM